MVLCNDLKEPVLAEMRLKFLECKKELSEYKLLYREEKKKCHDLRTNMTTLQKLTAQLQEKLNKFERQFAQDMYKPPSKKRQKCKQWDSIKSDRTKRERLSNYKDMILTSLKTIDKCHRAEISIWIEKNRVQFSWSPKDFKDTFPDEVTCAHANSTIFNDHPYSSKQEDLDNELEYEDIDFSEIFDANGNWKQVHIRKLVHVLDSFRISQKAYHELRMVSKGHMPPLRRLIFEKKKMSQEIPYEKHPEVSEIFILFHLCCTFGIHVLHFVRPLKPNGSFTQNTIDVMSLLAQWSLQYSFLF